MKYLVMVIQNSQNRWDGILIAYGNNDTMETTLKFIHSCICNFQKSLFQCIEGYTHCVP